jgi:hypothetical protein
MELPGVLQDAGLSCLEYVEQLTLLLFLKMADQLTEEPYNRPAIVPPELTEAEWVVDGLAGFQMPRGPGRTSPPDTRTDAGRRAMRS